MAYHMVCDPCRMALGIEVDRALINRAWRKASKSGVRVTERDETGKPFLVGERVGDVLVSTMAGCGCVCSENDHDPMQCTGIAQFKTAGRPGSSFVDGLAKQLGTEPIPELILALHEACELRVTDLVGWWYAKTDGERADLEASLDRMRYDDKIKLLRDILQAERPDLMAAEPYKSLKPRLLSLVSFRNKVAHSIPIEGDFFRRVKREGGKNVIIEITPEELAGHLDAANELHSQLHFVRVYIGGPQPGSAGGGT
ncbi:hypothetical protein Dvina_16735 [Dactylosporangium vinaceum]|uniref:RiboL-PSP-HEPN domain-containing protein n=1 Tax=Dactylosporangium vinaceum TaxID=53362 RepID=A0ABV5M8S2_9ACTN|nr:hypothetical protein [Dactylosporangium vinaceum]UAB99568.1 hypothetical protein Dvina_16735 [Dactylosporangium vinaceum]